MKKSISVLMLGAFGVMAANKDNTERLDRAAVVFEEIMGISDKAIPQTFLDKSECVVLVPGMKKGAFIVGAKFGRGFLSCRNKGGAGWSAPGAIRVEGGSVGFQIGGSETDVIMLVMNERGSERLLKSKFTLGGDASVAAGPVGRDASAQTDAMMTAEILTWSRSRGVFAGVSLQGATLRQDIDVNTDMYGKAYENAQIVRSGLAAPDAAKKLMGLLTKYSGRKSK
ncbi:MAG TPA: lipid-binding SYLF domain-containing protein [Bryobacteraceae bacterium]|nr:lipid-binding SYLF domain-containing protein [Bryobacteraceae bacterium]